MHEGSGFFVFTLNQKSTSHGLIWEQWENAHEPLKNKTYLGKTLLFFGCQFYCTQKQ